MPEYNYSLLGFPIKVNTKSERKINPSGKSYVVNKAYLSLGNKARAKVLKEVPKGKK